MNTVEAMEALKEGKKIRRKVWGCGDYVRLNEQGFLVDKHNHLCPIQISRFCSGWEIVE